MIAGLLNERTVPDRQLAAHQAETAYPTIDDFLRIERELGILKDEEEEQPLSGQSPPATPISEFSDLERGDGKFTLASPITDADTDSSSRVDLGTDSTNPVLAVREPDADASGAASLYFTRGSHRDDVLRIQGTPPSINRYLGLGHEVWKYGSSTVDISLRDGRVTEWNNTGNLKVSMEPGSNVTGDSAFTRGSHRDDVLRIQGTPSSINRYLGLGHEVWKYGSSTVDISLRDGRVTEWNNTGNLKASMDQRCLVLCPRNICTIV